MSEETRGRPPYKPTEQDRKQVETLAGYGFTEIQIGNMLGISDKTARKYYPAELAQGHLKANSMVAQSLYKKAMGDGAGAVTACIFWLKTRAGWKETSAVEFSGLGGGPIETKDVTARDIIASALARLRSTGNGSEAAGGSDGQPG